MPIIAEEQLLQQPSEFDFNPGGQEETDQYISGVVSHVKQCWEAAKRAKLPIETIMLDNLRRKAGQYDPVKLQRLNEQGEQNIIFMRLTEEKCAAAEAWIEEILLPSDDEPWSVDVTPRPELADDHVQQIREYVVSEAVQYMQLTGQRPTIADLNARGSEILSEIEKEVLRRAKENAKRTEIYIKDVTVESKWKVALKNAIPDIVLYPCGFVKGPLRRMNKDIIWADQGPAVERKEVLEYESPSPWDIYPSPTSTDIGDGYLIERMRFTRSDLIAMKGIEGYDSAAIDEVLSEATPAGNMSNWLSLPNDLERQTLENKEQVYSDPDGKIDALQFWGNIQGLSLLEYGFKDIQPFEEYFCELILIKNHVIKLELDGDPLGRPPYYKASFRRKKGSFWETSMVELFSDSQDVCNASARNLVKNMSIASGPQVGLDMDKMAPGEKITQLYPWKIWQFNLKGQPQQRDPLWFYQPNPLIEALMKVYEFFSNEADNKTGIPKYSYGNNQDRGGALSTASGFSMMMSNSARSIKKVIGNIDFGIIEPSIERLFQWLMLYAPIECMLQGDIKVRAKGSTALIAKEQQQIRRNEFLKIALHPVVSNILGVNGLSEILRKVVSGLEIDAEDVVPSAMDQNIQARLAQMQAQGQPPPGQQQIEGPNPGQGPQQDAAGNKPSGADMRTM